MLETKVHAAKKITDVQKVSYSVKLSQKQVKLTMSMASCGVAHV